MSGKLIEKLKDEIADSQNDENNKNGISILILFKTNILLLYVYVIYDRIS